jgi:hypothetical protein
MFWSMIFMDQKYYISLIPARGEQRSEVRDQGSGRHEACGMRLAAFGIIT